MAHTFALGQPRTSSSLSPVSFSYTVARGDTVLCLMIKARGATNRAGGPPDLGTAGTFTQAGSTQKAVTSPEASAEIWYLLNPTPGTYTLTVPNTGAVNLFVTVGIGKAAAGGRSYFGLANGSNNTSTNPTPGSVTCEVGDIVFAVVASGATTWAPSAQAGTNIANTDDGADGGGEQYSIRGTAGGFDCNWTFATSDDWGACVASFKEISPQAWNNYMGVDCVSAGVIGVTEKIR